MECPDRTYRFGDAGELDATLVVHDERFFLRALTGSDIGIGESFMDGDWTTPDLVPLVRLMLRNRRVLDGQSRIAGALRRLAGGIARRLRDNSLAGSRRHIHRHYDLGNDFFRLFLDAELLMYSCGYFESAADSLEQAQAQKVDRICRALQTRARRSRARDRQRVGRLRRLGGDPLRLPRDDHDDQRRAVPPRLRVAVADSARPGRASRCCAPTTAS